MTQPVWYDWALKEVGFHELPNNHGIGRYIALGHCGAQGDPWCAIFANAAFEVSGIPGTRSAMARSFEHDGNFVKLAGPALGCVVTFWRGIQSHGLGHVGFYGGEQGGRIFVTGGNEGDRVATESYRAHGATFGLSGYYWPKSVPLPVIGKLLPQFASVAGTGKVT